MNIFILEDNNERIEIFKKYIYKLFPHCNLEISEDAKGAEVNLIKFSYWDYIFLDHDLGGEIFVDSYKDNTGFQVAKFIKENNIQVGNIIVHSYNFEGVKKIMSILPDVSYYPFGPETLRQIVDNGGNDNVEIKKN